MTEVLLFVGIGTLLMISVATLGLAAITLKHAHRYVELAEARMEHLREVQALLLTFLNEERQRLKEQRPEIRRESEGREWELGAERDAEQRIERLKGELLQLRASRREVEQSGSSSSRPFEDVRGPRERPEEETAPTDEAQSKPPRPTGFPETRSSEPAETVPEDEKPRLGVWHPHPDDDVSPGRASAGRAPARSDVPVKIFRKHYDKYLENYEGYVKLAERIYKMRDEAPGSAAEREWEERLRRVNDGIKRTTARLDILEEYNPELATDDRVSRRASIARSHSELERSRQSKA